MGFSENDAAPMFERDFLSQGEAEAGAAGLADADEGLEERFADGFGDARAVIGDGEADVLGGFGKGDVDLGIAGALSSGLAGVEQQIVESALDFARVEPA